MLSTTFRMADWLFSAMSCGLDNTLMSPNSSSSLRAALKTFFPSWLESR